MSNELIASIDVGKTHTRLALIDPLAGVEVWCAKTVNCSLDTPIGRQLDIAGIERWLIDAFRRAPGRDRIGADVPIGHGAAAGIPPEVAELVTVDMAVVGAGQESDEFNPTLCIKDGGGPYHFGLNKKMRALAEKHNIPYKTDVYIYYGSDGEAFWSAGGDVALALIGPGSRQSP